MLQIGGKCRGIALAQRLVEGPDGIVFGKIGDKALCDIGLENIAIEDVFDDFRHRLHIGFAREIGLPDIARNRWPRGVLRVHRLLERRKKDMSAFGGTPFIRLFGQTGRDEPDPLRQVIEGKHDIMEMPDGVGHIALRLFARFWKIFQQPSEFIGEIADGPAMEWRKASLIVEAETFKILGKSLQRAEIQWLIVPAGNAIPDRQRAEGIGSHVGIAAKLVVPHGTVKKAQPAERLQAFGSVDWFQPGDFTDVHPLSAFPERWRYPLLRVERSILVSVRVIPSICRMSRSV